VRLETIQGTHDESAQPEGGAMLAYLANLLGIRSLSRSRVATGDPVRLEVERFDFAGAPRSASSRRLTPRNRRQAAAAPAKDAIDSAAVVCVFAHMNGGLDEPADIVLGNHPFDFGGVIASTPGTASAMIA
jgi:hypothetical protein